MTTLVFLPGIMGSELENQQGDKVWPPKISETIFGYKDIDRLLDAELTATRPIRRVALFYGVYDSLLDDIDRCGYKEGGQQRNFIPFAYDWRRPNRDTAALLAKKLDSVFIDENLIFVAHSMGGLICRHLIESGLYRDRVWFSQIKMLITLGTPHLGAPASLSQITGHQKNLGLSRGDIRRLASDSRYTSAYELAPHDGHAMVLRRASSGEVPETISSFASEIANEFSLNLKNAEVARAFWSTLNLQKKPKHIRYFSFVGAAFKTRSLNVWDGAALETLEFKASGDGTVPISSSMNSAIVHEYSRKKHAVIFEDRVLRRRLYQLLDAPEGIAPHAADSSVMLDAPENVGLSVDQDVYEAGEPIEVILSFAGNQTDPRILLKLDEIDFDSEDQVAKPISEEPISVQFRGADIRDFTFTLNIELRPGFYSIHVVNLPTDDPATTTFSIAEPVAN